MHSILLWQLTIALLVMTVYAVKPTPTKRTSGPSSQFVTTQNGQFFVNGRCPPLVIHGVSSTEMIF